MEKSHIIGLIVISAFAIFFVFLGILTGETTKETEIIEEQIPAVDESATNEEIVERTQEKTEEIPEEILKETLEVKQEIITKTLEKTEEQTTQLPIVTLSSIGHNVPETDPVLKGRATLYIILNKVYPNQRFYIFRKDSPVDVKVGDFYVDTVRSRCLQASEGGYNNCKHTELLPLDGARWSTGDYYIQAKAKINDPNGEYKAGELIGDKVYFNYIK